MTADHCLPSSICICPVPVTLEYDPGWDPPVKLGAAAPVEYPLLNANWTRLPANPPALTTTACDKNVSGLKTGAGRTPTDWSHVTAMVHDRPRSVRALA
jgi:hypothetical protein